MSKHTPGPWTIVETKYPNIISNWHIQIGKIEIPFFPYKRVYSEDKSLSAFISDDEQKANARLIAAAPDLLAFAQVIADLVIVPPMMTEQARQLMWLQDISRVVIANATGEQP